MILDIQMAKMPTPERVRELTPAQIRALYDNAQRSSDPGAGVIIAQILEEGLLRADGGGLPRDHPTIRLMEEIVRSDEGRSAAIKATQAGLPAIAGVDALLSAQLGSAYGSLDTTSWAGSLVAEIMYEAGYEQIGKGTVPNGMVAKRAAVFKPR